MRKPSDSRSPFGPALGPWLSLAAIWLLFDLPMALAPNRVDLRLLRPTGEVLVLFSALALSDGTRRGRALRWGLLLVAVSLALLRIDRSVFFVLTRTEPLLYDQVFMLRHLVVLVSDLLSVEMALGLLFVALSAVAAGFGVRALFRRAAPLLDGSRAREVREVGAGAWAILLLATLLGPRSPRTPWVRWMTPDLVRNVAESRRIYDVTRERITESPYRRFDAVRLVRKPDVLLLFVESYGKLIAEDPAIRPAWVEALTGMQTRLSRGGWHAVSAYSTAPVSGGRSWLAVGSILMGTTIRYESVFHQLIDAVVRLPTLVRFFARQGYETVLLAPSDRSRLGIRAENRYGYDHYLRFTDLGYAGPMQGWGVVPDQYALGFAEDHVLASVGRPLFFHFHMVSSHAPWGVIPDYLRDYRSWNQTGAKKTESQLTDEVSHRLRRYTREDARQSYMGALTAPLREGFVASVLYDLRVVEDFLSTRQRDTLVILMGDHQPPVVAPETMGFDVPIHVLARDPALLDELVAHGFSPGLVLPPDGAAKVAHAGLFSLVVRTLARSCGDGSRLPEYFPYGVGGDRAPE